MDNPEKVENAGKKKEAGNELYKSGKFSRAAKKYAKVRYLVWFYVVCKIADFSWLSTPLQAVKLIEYDSQFSEEEKRASKTLKISCNLNEAACKLKLGNFSEAQKLCSKVGGNKVCFLKFFTAECIFFWFSIILFVFAFMSF